MTSILIRYIAFPWVPTRSNISELTLRNKSMRRCSATVYCMVIIQGCIQKFQDSTCKRCLLNLDIKFLHHLQCTPLLHEYIVPCVFAMLGSNPGSPFFGTLSSTRCDSSWISSVVSNLRPFIRSFSLEKRKNHRGPDHVSMGDEGSLSCSSWPQTAKL